MKPILPLLALVALIAPVRAQTSAPAPKFDWKLRLTKGQSWTQTTTSRLIVDMDYPSHKEPRQIKTTNTIMQTMSVKNEVLEATPSYYLIRATYGPTGRMVTMTVDGKTVPVPERQVAGDSPLGASFTIKQASDGRVLDVSGVEDFLARQKAALSAMQKNMMPAPSQSLLPYPEDLKGTIVEGQGAHLPQKPLALGQSYSYALSMLSLSFPYPLFTATFTTRTLRSLDAKSATFDEATIVSPSLYGGRPSVIGMAKTYTTLRGTTKGQGVIDVATGLTLSRSLTTEMTMQMNMVSATGAKTTAIVHSTDQETVSTSLP